MHILLIHQAFTALDEPGGTRHAELARYLAERGHRVTVIASPVSYLTGRAQKSRIPWVERQMDGERIVVLRAYTYPALHRSFAHRVFSFFSFMFSSFWIGLRVPQVDLVWGTSPPIFQAATSWALSQLKGRRFLFEVRDLWPAFAIGVGVLRQPILIRASEWLERFLYRHADQVLVNSPGFIEHIEERGARRVVLLPNGADPQMFNPQSNGSSFRSQHHLEDKFVVLYAGAHGLSNDLGVVLDAADRLRDQSQIMIVLLGAGKDKSLLQSRAKQLGLTNVLFVPPIPKSEIPEALAAADACIAILKPIPLYRTVYPNKVFDYMAAGRPVILAIDGVIRRVIETAGAGIPVPPGDPAALAEAIRKLATNPALGKVMGQGGRQAVERDFDRSRLAEQLESILLNLVTNR